VSALCTSGRLRAEPWSTQPLVGVAGQYTSNPRLVAEDVHAESNAALLLNAPVNYDSDDFHVAVTPNIRYGNASGYSSITSNYFHLDSLARLDTERSSTTVSASLYRDSSLLYAGELSNGFGVRRDTSIISTSWQDLLTERLQLQLGANTSRTLYGQAGAPAQGVNQGNALGSLVDYRYSTFLTALAYLESERNTLRLIGSAGRYEALDDVSDSESESLQLGFDRQLSEIWTLKTTAGYSRAQDRYNYFLFGKYLLGVIDSTQTGTVYSADLVRQGATLTLDMGVSRSLAPTGFAYLVLQEGVNMNATYTFSERWSYNAAASWQTNTYPATQGGSSFDRKYYNVTLSAKWQWTEQWALSIQVNRVAQTYGSPTVSGASSGVSLEISRQFNRKDL
jgi:hypothetical protein